MKLTDFKKAADLIFNTYFSNEGDTSVSARIDDTFKGEQISYNTTTFVRRKAENASRLINTRGDSPEMALEYLQIELKKIYDEVNIEKTVQSDIEI